MRIEFYKPNKGSTGVCATFDVYTAADQNEKKNGFYINILKQSSWNDATKTGSFIENVNDPAKHKKIKLNDLELCNILYVIENGREKKFSTVHKNGDKTTPIFFEPYIKDETFIGYLLKIDGVSIAFNLIEAIKIREYVKVALSTLYTS